MLLTTVVGSWPPAPQFHARLASLRHNALPAPAAEALLTDMAAVAIAQKRPVASPATPVAKRLLTPLSSISPSG